MNTEHINANIASWEQVSQFVEEFISIYAESEPEDYRRFSEWQSVIRQFIKDFKELGYHKFFRAGTMMRTLVFSTLDHHGLADEPHVTVKIESEELIKLVYHPAIPAPNGDKMLEYDLSLVDALPTLRRFFHHLWQMTRPEAIPTELFVKKGKYQAPVLNENDQLNSMRIDLF